MTIDQFQTALHQLPFRPFTIRMVDGRAFDVRHPDFVARSESGRTVIVFHGGAESYSVLDLLLMSELEVHVTNGHPAQRYNVELAARRRLMAYDNVLAERVRKLLGRRKSLVEMRMFGGLGFLLNGNICCGVWKEFLILRLGDDATRLVLSEEHARPFDITGRPMRGWAMVEPEGWGDDARLRRWVDWAIEFTKSLPAKQIWWRCMRSIGEPPLRAIRLAAEQTFADGAQLLPWEASMAWLFERTVELAAWVALIVAWVSAVLAAIWIVRWFGTLKTGAENELLWASAQAAAAFVGFTLALGLLAAVDRFIFDSDQKVA